MKSFTYTIKDSAGIHARPAGMVVSEAKKFASTITIKAGEKSANATRLMAIMTMGVKCGAEVIVEVEGDDEDVAVVAMQEFFEANL